MDAERIVQDLKRRFALPLPDFGDIKIAKLTGNNTFAVKKLLCKDDTESNYLVYDSRPFMKDDDNWLINVQLYSEEFRADLNSIWMDEMGLPMTPIIRNQVKNYGKFFRAKDRRDAVKISPLRRICIWLLCLRYAEITIYNRHIS